MVRYYWHKGYTPELKLKLHNAIDESNTNLIYDLLAQLQPIFIGYSQHGWKFTFCPHDFIYFRPRIGSFLLWLKSADFITNDERVKMSPDEFLQLITPEIYNKELYDSKKWWELNNHRTRYDGDMYTNDYLIDLAKQFSLKYNVAANQYSEFYLGEFLFNINASPEEFE